MILENFSSLILLGIFFGYRLLFSFTLTPFVKRLLNGPLRHLSLNYFNDLTKEQFDLATNSNDSQKAWETIALAKIQEMGHSKTSYEKRRQNLLYVRNNNPTKRIAEGIAEVLPYQHNLSFQQELACYLCGVLDKFENGHGNNIDSMSIINPLSAPLDALNNLFSSWLACLTLLVLFWTRLDNYSVGGIALNSVLALSLICYPVLQVKLKLRTIISYIIFSIFAILIALSLFAFANHSGISQKIIPLNAYGINGTVVAINYPKWLTIDDVQSCGKSNSISVLVKDGELPGHMAFNFDTTLFSALNDECNVIDPDVTPQNSQDVAYKFHFAPLDRLSLIKPETKIIPVLVLPTGSFSLDNYQLHIRVEQIHWGLIRQAVLLIASGGGLTFFVLMSQLVTFLKKS